MARVVVNHESKVPKMGTVGVIGGLGQWATLDVLERIFRVAAERIPQYGNRGYPPMNIRIVNHAPMMLNSDGSYPEILEPSKELLDAAIYVSDGANFLIILSNTAHIFTKEIEKVANKKVLSIVDVTIEEVIKRKCKRVGVLAIGPTLDKRLYQNPLEASGLKIELLPEELSEKLDNEGIYPLQEGERIQNIKPVAFQAVEYFRAKKVDGIILGCTEIPILLGSIADDSDILNSSQLLAEAVVKEALL